MKHKLLPVLLLGAALYAETTLTIYNDNLGVVKEVREIDFTKGVSEIKFTDVAETIDPTSVSFTPADGANIELLEQNYEYDLVNPYGLLEKYIDKDIELWVQKDENDSPLLDTYRLLSYSGNEFVLLKEGRLVILTKDVIRGIQFPQSDDKLLTRPTLVWLASSDTTAKLPCQVAYMARQISWKANYSMIINEAEDAMDFSGWVTITNNSGKDYQDASIKLIAGDVRIIREAMPRAAMMEDSFLYARNAKMAGAGFQEKSFQDFHLYTLGRKSTINNKQVKQIQFIEPAEGVKLEKYYRVSTDVANAGENTVQPDICFEFKNEKQNELGIALPKGLIRVFKQDSADGSLEFVGESPIDHTPKDEDVEVSTGQAFDIACEITTTKVDNRSNRIHNYEKAFELRNHKDAPAEVRVEFTYPVTANCKVTTKENYEMPRAGVIRFTANLNAGEERKFEFAAELDYK